MTNDLGKTAGPLGHSGLVIRYSFVIGGAFVIGHSPEGVMPWTRFRAHFPVTKRWAFFDHAAVAPIPDTAAAALEDYARRIADNGLADVWHWVDRVSYVRKLAAQLVN